MGLVLEPGSSGSEKSRAFGTCPSVVSVFSPPLLICVCLRSEGNLEESLLAHPLGPKDQIKVRLSGVASSFTH